MSDKLFSGKLALQQRVLPAYRASFLDALAAACQGGLSVFAGMPGLEEGVSPAGNLEIASFCRAQNRHFLRVDHRLYLCWQSGLLDWLRAWNPDALIVEANPRYPSTRIGVRWMRARGRPVIGWGLGAPHSEGLLAALRGYGWARFARQFDALIAYSQRGRREYCALGIPAARVYVATNAVAPQPSKPPRERPPHFTDRPRVLFIGRLQVRKRIDHLLQACAALPDELQPHLDIVGDGPARSEYLALAARIYPRANFPGARYGDALMPYFANADLFVLPGTGGLAVQEAMAHGLPVIVAQGDGTQEDLVRAGNGWLVPPDDQAALTATLREALSDAPRLRLMGDESYRIVTEEINIEAMVEVFVRVLNEAKRSAPE